MTQTEKELLLKELCMRLPHGVNVATPFGTGLLTSVRLNNSVEKIGVNNDPVLIRMFSANDVKPYLFPLSSMTEEQFEELKAFADLTYEGNTLELVEWDSTCDKTLEFWLEEIPSYCVIKVFDWLNKNHFDYRGLIPMGLANDATGKNIYKL